MQAPISKIDITHLVGVALILVIVFMVTSPMMMTPVDMDLDLPKAKTIEAKSQSNITISCSKTHALFLNESEITFELLGSELKKLIKKHPDRQTVIRADKDVKHKQVLRLLAIIKKAGAINIAIATLQRNREKI